MTLATEIHLQAVAERWAQAHNLGDLQSAVRAARERTGCGIGTQVKQGLFRVVRIEYGKTTTVTPLSDWCEKGRAITFLEAL